jgi:hypothetical protein
VVASRLMEAEDVLTSAWAIVERCYEVFEGVSGIIGQFGKERLGFCFRKRPHFVDFDCLIVVWTLAERGRKRRTSRRGAFRETFFRDAAALANSSNNFIEISMSKKQSSTISGSTPRHAP